MGLWITSTIILGIATAVIFVVRAGYRKPSQTDGMSYGFNVRPWLTGAAATCILLWGFVTLIASVKTIDAGHVGVVKEFGDCTGTMQPGWNFKAPWQQVDDARLTVQGKTIIMDGQEGRGSAVSAETQPVFANVTINYKLDPNKVEELLCTNVGKSYYEVLVAPRVPQVFKSETVKYSTVEVAPNREKIRGATQKVLDTQLDTFGIDVVDFLINDLDFDPDFSKAITRKQVATQDALAAKEKVQQSKFEAQQVVEKARGDARANRLRRQSLTPLLVEWERVQKWQPQWIVPARGSVNLWTSPQATTPPPAQEGE